MFTLNARSLALFFLLSVAWVGGAAALCEVIADFSNQWYWFVLSTIYVITINEHFLHCTIGHISYKIDPARWFYKLLVFLSSTSLTFGTVRAMITMHSTHHIYSDQDKHDYLSLRKRWITAALTSPLMFIYTPYPLSIPNQKDFIYNQSKKYKKLLDDPWTKFCDRNQALLTITLWAVLFLATPEVLIKFVFMGRILMSFYTAINTVVGHSSILSGYRNFNTPDHSHNNLVFHYIFLGFFSTLLHNNHHGANCSKTHKHHWWEYDTGALVTNYIIKPLICEKS